MDWLSTRANLEREAIRGRKMKVIIAGSREGFTPEDVFEGVACIHRYSGIQIDEIVSGGAIGIDTFGEELAKTYSIPIKMFPANWTVHGKSAGFLRNEEMAKYANCLIAFWDGQSKGTKHMIEMALKYGLKLFVFTQLKKGLL